MNHEPEDLPNELTIVPSRAGEQARMKNRVQSSRSGQALRIFYLDRARRRIGLAGLAIIALLTG